MSFMTPIQEGALVPSLQSMEVIIPFEEGATYWQVDLDGRDVVEGVAKFYIGDNPEQIGRFAARAIETIQRTNNHAPGTYAVFVSQDEGGFAAMVYEREMCERSI